MMLNAKNAGLKPGATGIAPMQGHVVPKKTYFLVFFTLIALTALTTAVAFQDLGPMNTVAALAIAVGKATLVILFFMHLKYSPGLTRLVIVAAFFWLAILIALTLSDVFTRNWTPNPAGWQSSLLLDKTGRALKALPYDCDRGNCSATSSSASSRLRTLPSSCASS